MNNQSIVVMGVSGCGKSLIGQQLAKALQLPFFDADDFHSEDNVNKMASGVPLTEYRHHLGEAFATTRSLF